MTVWTGATQPFSLFDASSGQAFEQRGPQPGDALWVSADDREFLAESDAEESWNSGIHISVRHLQNPEDVDFFGDVPKKFRNYGAVSFQTRAFIRYGLTEVQLRKVGLDIEKNNGMVLMSTKLLADIGAEVRLGDLIEYGDGKRFVVQEIKDLDEGRRLNEPEVLRLWVGIDEYRQTTGQKTVTR